MNKHWRQYFKPICIIFIIGIMVYGILDWFEAKQESSHLVLHGNVDIRQVDLGFRIGGRIAQMKAEEGDAVKAGEVLAVLDAEPYQHAADLAQAEVAQAEFALLKLQHGNRPQEVKQAYDAVNAQRTNFLNADQSFKRQETLLKTGMTSKQAYDNAFAAQQEAQANLQAAEEAFTVMQEGARQEDVGMASAAMDAAQTRFVIAHMNLTDATLLAPSDGYVLTRIQEPGAMVGSGSPVYTLSVQHPVWVRTYVAEPDLGHVKPGMKVSVYSDSRKEPFEGEVGYIASTAEFTPKNIETKELRTSLVYRMRITITDPNNKLRQGMPVTVHINVLDK